MRHTPQLRGVTYAVLTGLAAAIGGIGWLFGTVITGGHELSAVEDVTLDLLIGAVVLLALSWLVLHYQLRRREQYRQAIDAAKKSLDTAITHMSHGLVMFDATCRIVICNRRYIDMYGVSPAVVRPGLSLRELLIHRKETGSFISDVDEYCTAIAANVAQRKTTTLIIEGRDGRHVRIINEPLEGGGWVATHEDVTEQLRAEERLREQKLQLDTALNTMSQGLNMFDGSGRLIVCNDQYLRMYRLSAEVVKPGCTVRELVDARIASGTFFSDNPLPYTAKLMKEMSERKDASSTRELPDGRTIAVRSQPTADGTGWVVTHEDITERQKLLEARELSEKAVSEQKVRLDAALNNMTHGLCMFDGGGRIVLFNRRYMEMMGETAEFLQGRLLLDLWKHRQAAGSFVGDPDELFSRVLKTMREGKSKVEEMVRQDGGTVRVVDQPMEGGGWVATLEDITDQRCAERERDRNRRFLDLIIDHVPSAIFVKNASDRTYVLVNRAAEQFWNVSRSSMIGRTASDVFSEEEARKIDAREDDLVRSGKALFDEREVLAPLGGLRSIGQPSLNGPG